jgi:glycerol-3-phosphate dehydrogenase (NAD(P)+)
MTAQIGILGAGGWGTALAVLLQANSHHVCLWEFRKDAAIKLSKIRENVEFLPGVRISEKIEIVSELEKAVINKDIILLTLPSHVIRSVGVQMASIPLGDALIVSGSKGIENDSLLRVSEVLEETIPTFSKDRIVILSGPSHAEEVGNRIPTVVVAASHEKNSSLRVQEIFISPVFRVYTSDDPIGVELGGSLKNVIAIAAGMCDGVGFGDNTKAALLTRGIVEITRLGTALGADPVTFAGLSGIGDLIVTCTSRYSRNRYLGEQIGKGRTTDEILNEMVMVVEGVKTTRSAVDLAKIKNVELPITQEVFNVLFKNKNPRQAVYDLMTRDPKKEDII